VCTTNGEILAKELKRRSAKTLEMTSLVKDQEDQVIPTEEIAWTARIMWARQ
jgi:phage repressor protein C with HTH and peptisase S24 domain